MVNTSSVAPPFSGEENIVEYDAAVEYNGSFGHSHVYYWHYFDSLTVLSSLCGLMGNGVVIWLLGFCMKRNPFTTYILNLAVADFGTLLSMFIRVIVLYSDPYSIYYLLLDGLVFFTYSASMYFLTAISLERCLSVLFPIWYRCHRSGRSSAVVSFLLWTIPALLFGTLWAFYEYLQHKSFHNLLNTIFSGNLLIFTPIVVVSTLIMSIKIYRSSQRRQPPRLYITSLVTLLFFLIFAVPLSVTFFVLFNIGIYLDIECSLLFASFNSSINPFVYYFVGRDRKKNREPLKAVLKRAFKDEAKYKGGT